MNSSIITLKEIARRLGVSKSTVSRALRDSSEIGEETKRKVLELAQELSYSPNPIALSLQRSRSQTIGIIVPEIANSFFALVISGVEEVAYRMGYHIIIYQSHDSVDREVADVRNILVRRADGLVVSTASSVRNGDHFRTLQEQGIPVVFFDRKVDNFQTHQVLVDDFDGAFRATEHLIAQGCRRLACLTGPQHLPIVQQRTAGFRAALHKNNLPVREEWLVEGPFRQQSGNQLTKELCANAADYPDGILAASTSIALGAHLAIREMGLRMPEQVALIGFSDPPIAPLLDPPLSSVAQPGFEMGQQAAELLIDLIEKKGKPIRYQTRILQTDLVIRKSSERKGSMVEEMNEFI
ncbi:LacI family DNA-binding transcriptional regulator [Siphonobacter aquaeclarae]|uniref:Transcriptional regulator, LacI family n=1 Tax=Siphonobacter aquaeclarae TaxID=563176 RepID=A0A1G9KFY5_9BACT|nr:LacI family DNA-binding transcriptional regulator [Siphonobacter aquaeclarae]SDL48718.1 transcriptional regulator, LacI family [Siphonobacter aquaeclarae]